MDGRELIAALAAVAAAPACRGAVAAPAGDAAVEPSHDEPAHGIDVPATWRELPAIAEAAVDAAREVLAGATVHAHAWGEPARGCYLAVIDLHGQRRDTIAVVERELEAALGDAAEVTEWTTSPDAEDRAELGARFSAGRMRGQLRVRLQLDGRRLPHALAAACFYNDRQPELCDDTCAPLLAMLEPLTLSASGTP
ncbi:MAG: hypothetical protein H6709_15465 [Kofleriaceae bacterium]|nr:hypothetical protein [Kofleriaceae bacterium]MCB9573477.1 hypothetical protein [Kofleriaceae bacterium]